MLNFQRLLANKSFKHFLIIAMAMALIYLVLRITISPADPVIPLINTLIDAYLYIPEWIANLIFKSGDAGVILKDHDFIFETRAAYHEIYSAYIENWPRYLLVKKLSALILVLIWATVSPFRKKIRFSLIFLLTHIVSIVAGLYSLGVVYPRIIDDQTGFILTVNLAGTVVMLIFLFTWVLLNKEALRNTLQKLKINVSLSDRKINEIVVLLFFLSLLSHYFIPFFAFKPYVYFLLESTRRIAYIFGYDGYITGDQLVGINAHLGLSKHCLGFMTMYIFASLVYLTRLKEGKRTTWVFILSGLGFLMILNLVRLILLFIIVQGENGVERASSHHEIYNVVIYLFIFIMWVVWYEFFIAKAKKKKAKTGVSLDDK